MAFATFRRAGLRLGTGHGLVVHDALAHRGLDEVKLLGIEFLEEPAGLTMAEGEAGFGAAGHQQLASLNQNNLQHLIAYRPGEVLAQRDQ